MSHPRAVRPQEGEHNPYFGRYIQQVPDGDVLDVLRAQAADFPALLAGVDEAGAAHRYGPDKWSIKQVVGHLSDTERVMTYRLLCIARGDTASLPGFDENAFAENAGSDARPFADLLAEWSAVRAATLALVTSLPDDAWGRVGTANGNPATPRALAWVTAGHLAHHVAILRERYL